MRAASAVLVLTQRPMTFFGIAPTLLALVGAAGTIGMMITILADVIALMLPVAGALVVGTWAWAWRNTRRDHHFDRGLMLAPRFWRGRRHDRVLLAGARR